MNLSVYNYLFGLPLLIVLILSNTRTYSQTNTIEILAETIVQECPKYYFSQESTCPEIDADEIQNKLEIAEIYLKNRLNGYVLSDTSTHYEEQKKTLQTLNKKYDESSIKDQDVLDKFEKQYLLLSILRVDSCDEYFDRLMQLYYRNNGSRRSCGVGDVAALMVTGSNGKCVPSESLLIFKTWLTDLLIDKFQTETESFDRLRSVNFINWMYLFTSKPFEGDLKDEKELFQNLTDWAHEAMKGNYLYPDNTLEELLAETYRARSTPLSKWNTDVQDSTVFRYIEKLLLASMELVPDPRTEYSLGVNYYNYAMSLYRALDNETFRGDSVTIKSQADTLSAIGLELYEKALKELEIEK